MSTPLSKPQMIVHIQKSLNYTVFDSKWIPCSAKFVCMGNFARGTGVMQIYEVQRGDALLIKEVEKPKPIKCATFGATSIQQRHMCGLFLISYNDRWTSFGFFMTGHAFNEQDRCVCAGYDNGDIKLFDLRNMSVRWETNIKNGVCCVEFDRKDIDMNKLVATSLEGKFHVFDLRTQHPTKGFASVCEKAHKSTIWQVKHLPQNREIFMTAGGAGNLHLWKYEYPRQRCKKESNGVEVGVAGTVNLLQNVTVSTQPIASLDWNTDKRGLFLCSGFDQTVRVLIVTKLNLV
uniref:Dynein axonemal assembly factor 10 n=1 Tax=Cynoglossus semilaevis TaxID=244447 RepID=A0A3P8UJL4_CYNSE